ncbi:MAG: glycosyl hydrolase family protein [Bacteroidetes bacterium]|nr:glycosyl hydrolase family protein [Bacteroidota bacterium]
MRRDVLFFMFLFCSVVHVPAQSKQIAPLCPLGNEWKWVPEYSDEFDGTTLNDEKWWDFNPAWVGRKPAYFDRGNVMVKNGNLELYAKSLRPEEVSVENKARGLDKFSTAIVKSKKRILYGYFEARSRSMRSSVCNAFWLYDPLDADKKYREGDASEEIDIFELFGKLPDPQLQRTFWATVHRYETPYVESIVNKKKTKLPDYSFRQLMPFDFYSDFHVYGLLWTPEKLVWYVDGKEVFQRVNDYFHRPLHIVFDAEIMEDWVGLPDVADLPSVFSTDYVRVWQLK